MRAAPTRKKLTGFAHVLAAASFSMGGLARLRQEAAFRQEIAAGFGLSGVYLWLAVDAGTALTAAVLFLLLIAAEAFNTAIEVIVDRISPEISETGRHAKDLGSLAVFCLVLANGLLLLYTLAMAFLS
ncbi:MAG: diacylglycerol kinase [Pseudorhizobium sp.]